MREYLVAECESRYVLADCGDDTCRFDAECQRWLSADVPFAHADELLPVADPCGAHRDHELVRRGRSRRGELEHLDLAAERLDAGGLHPSPCRHLGHPRSAAAVHTGTLELRGIRVPRALALPEVKDAGRIPALLRSLAPVAGRQHAVLLPGPAGHVQATVAVPRDAQEAHRRRFALAPHGQRELPPKPLDWAAATLGLNRLAELLVD